MASIASGRGTKVQDRTVHEVPADVSVGHHFCHAQLAQEAGVADARDLQNLRSEDLK